MPPLDSPCSEASRRGARPRASAGVLFLAGILFLLAIYCLSPLPVFYALFRLDQGLSSPAWEIATVVYQPLGWVYDRNQAVHAFYDWYLKPLERVMSVP